MSAHIDLPAAPRNDVDNRPLLPWPSPGARPQYEHWYCVVLHPEQPLALWFRQSLLQCQDGRYDLRVWATLSDAEHAERNLITTRTLPAEQLQIDAERFGLRHGELAALYNGRAHGQLPSPAGELAWDLQFEPQQETFRVLQSELALKLLTRTRFISPNGQVRADGWIRIGDSKILLRGAAMTQGHMYGLELHSSWVWGSCPRFDNAPDCAFQGVASRKAGRNIMSFELLLDGQRHLFNRVRHVRGRGLGLLGAGTRTEFELGRWDFEAVHDGLAVRGQYRADRDSMHRVRYLNVDGQPRYNCSQLRASLELEVRERSGRTRQLICNGRAPLEFVASEPALGEDHDYLPVFDPPSPG